MTFSANPARSSFRDRLRQLSGPQRALNNLLLTALALLLGGALLSFFLVRAVVDEQATQLGSALASDAAERAAEYLVHNDLVSLNVITSSLSRQAGIVGVTVYDRHRQPLAQSGLVQATPDTLLVSADILTEENELRGTVEILLQPRSPLAALARFDYAVTGWLGFAVLLLLVVNRLQREVAGEAPATTAAARSAGTERALAATTVAAAGEPVDDDAAVPVESPLAHLPEGPILRIDIVNYTTLEQRLAPRVLADLVTLYGDILAHACAIYHGQVTRAIDHQCLVTFPSSGADEDEVLFRAVCCAQLFFGVVRETNEARRSLGKMTMQFTAALHSDPALERDESAIVTWEICKQAGTAGRLTVTDTISDHPMLGERLVTDSTHRHVLQIELPAAAEGATRLQDVLALGVLKLAEPWEELLVRQVKRLSEPAPA